MSERHGVGSAGASASAAAAAAAELHLKMSKKVAQLTKVIFHLNTRNEDYEAEAAHTRSAHAQELQRLTQDAAAKLRALQSQLQTQTTTAAQRERQHIADRQQLMLEAQQQQRRAQASRVAMEQAFQNTVTELETQVSDAQRAFEQRLEQLTQIAAAKEEERLTSSEAEAAALQSRLDGLSEKHTDEVEQLVMTSNAKYNRMLAEQLRAQDALKADLVSAARDWEQQKQSVEAERERQRVAQEQTTKTAFDKMKHELVTKIEALLADTETLRGHEATLRQEKETLVKSQQETARATKTLELQLSKAQQKAQSVRQDASAHAEELQRMLAVGTDKIDQLAQELVTLKQTLQTRDRALTQAQKALEAAQLETLQHNASASEREGQLQQQLKDRELQLANGKAEALLASQETEDLQKKLGGLETRLAAANKGIADWQAEGAANALSRADLQQELERVATEAKQARGDSERALKQLKEAHESKQQDLVASHARETEDKRMEAARQLQQLEARVREASAKSSDETMAELNREHVRVLSEHQVASKAAQTKLQTELSQLETQTTTLREQSAQQEKLVADLQKKHMELTRQLETSQQQTADLQTAKNALQKTTQKTQKERDETHQKQLRELATQRETAVKNLTEEKTQQQQTHARALTQLAQEHAAALGVTQLELDTQRQTELTSQAKTMRELYEPQLTKLREELAELQRVLEDSVETATETQRAMGEIRLFEQEQLRSAIVGFAERTAAQRSHSEEVAQQELESLRDLHGKREHELKRRLLDDTRAQLARLQAKADAGFEQLAADHRQDLQTVDQQHAEALQNLQERLESAHTGVLTAVRAEAARELYDLRSEKDRERSEALQDAQNRHDQQYEELRGRMEATETALTKKTLEWASSTRDGQNLSAALTAKTQEMAEKVAALEKSTREQVETLKLAAKREMDKLLEENLAETKQLSDQFEETRRLMMDKVTFLKTAITEWEDKYARRESRREDVARIADLERLVSEKEALVRRTLDEMGYFKRELLNREEMYNKTFARAPNVGVLQVLKPHVQLQQQMQMTATPPPQPKRKGKPGGPMGLEPHAELQRRRSERSGLSSSPPSSATSSSSANHKALPPLSNNHYVT
ncbi:hypothetical protein BBJ28_00005091 [Nothophytophthora sp. Chile5]|nr:hypothetical protein BBJ28_00005091 [Nothophytophthora sp. Chile5]